MAGNLKLTHQAPLTWHSRGAPLCPEGSHAPTWRERAARHRAHLGVHPRCGGDAIGSARPDARGPEPAEKSDAFCVASEELAMAPSRFADEASDEDGEAEDRWETVARVDLERYIVYKNSHLHVLAAKRGCASVPTLEHTSVWQAALEMLAAERSLLRRGLRATHWPCTLRGAGADDEVVVAHLHSWIEKVEALGDTIEDEDAREALREFPLAVLLRHALADRYAAAGDLRRATEVLVRAVSTGPGCSHPHDTPLLLCWEGNIRCGFVRAHQCLRFGRVALLSARSLLLGAHEDAQAYTPELRARRAAERGSAVEKAAGWARRHLVAARSLFDAELSGASALSEASSWTQTDASLWSLALRCARLEGLLLLAEALPLAGRHKEAEDVGSEAKRESAVLQADPWAAPRLRQVLAGAA